GPRGREVRGQSAGAQRPATLPRGGRVPVWSAMADDSGGAYRQAFTRRVRVIGIRDQPISPRSPCHLDWVIGHHCHEPSKRSGTTVTAPTFSELPSSIHQHLIFTRDQWQKATLRNAC